MLVIEIFKEKVIYQIPLQPIIGHSFHLQTRSRQSLLFQTVILKSLDCTIAIQVILQLLLCSLYDGRILKVWLFKVFGAVIVAIHGRRCIKTARGHRMFYDAKRLDNSCSIFKKSLNSSLSVERFSLFLQNVIGNLSLYIFTNIHLISKFMVRFKINEVSNLIGDMRLRQIGKKRLQLLNNLSTTFEVKGTKAQSMKLFEKDPSIPHLLLSFFLLPPLKNLHIASIAPSNILKLIFPVQSSFFFSHSISYKNRSQICDCKWLAHHILFHFKDILYYQI